MALVSMPPPAPTTSICASPGGLFGKKQHHHAMEIGEPRHLARGICRVGGDGGRVDEGRVLVIHDGQPPNTKERWFASAAMTPSAQAKVTVCPIRVISPAA
jgi:hypothetical protein